MGPIRNNGIMRSIKLLVYFVFAFIAVYISVSYGDFSYDIDTFTVVSGSSTFIDEFDDGIEPPDGPSGSSTYSVPFSFSTNRESGGFLNLNSDDAVIPDCQCERTILATLDDSTFFINSGTGGRVEAKYSFTSGITMNTSFSIGLFAPIAPAYEAIIFEIQKEPSGSIFAGFYYESNTGDVDISEVDISNSLTGITDITLRLDVSTANEVIASIDFGSDETFDLTMPGSQTITFTLGVGYAGVFEVLEEIPPTPDIKANNSDSSITIGTGDTLSITVELDPGGIDGEDADWWIAEATPDEWYYYSLTKSWTSAGSSYDNLVPTYQGALFDLSTYEVLNTTGLSEGTHTFYFAIDTNMDGNLDLDQIYYDSVEVNVTSD